MQNEKPSFRQIISHNIRYKDESISHTLKTLDKYTSDVEYETLYLYLFGCAFKNGDVISVDVGVVLQEYIGDSAYTFALGDLKPEISQLLKVTKESLQLGIAQAKAGNRVGDIGFAIQDYTEKKHHYGVVRELTGHGLGKGLHEGPEVPNYGKRGSGQKLKEGLVICIEPMINLGKKEVHTAEDDWTVLTQDGSISAHYEQTIAIKKGEPDVLANFEEIEKNIFKNKVLNNSFLA